MRPTIKELYNIDPKILARMNMLEGTEFKLDAITARKSALVKELMSVPLTDPKSYERISAIDAQVKYIDKTIKGLSSDIEEMKL